MSKIIIIISSVYYWAVAHLQLFHFDKKYIKGKHFASCHGSLFAEGWKWIVISRRGVRKFKRNKKVKFPISPFSLVVADCNNLEFDADDLHIFQNPGLYIQCIGKIKIGKGCYIGPNTGLITANHDLNNLDFLSQPKDIELGEKTWIGMNCTILPGVKLGPNTIVGGGSVVTKSFEEGNVVIAGNPAKIIRKLNG